MEHRHDSGRPAVLETRNGKNLGSNMGGKRDRHPDYITTTPATTAAAVTVGKMKEESYLGPALAVKSRAPSAVCMKQAREGGAPGFLRQADGG